MRDLNRRQYANNWRKKHHNAERQQYRNFKSALNAQISPVIEYVRLFGITDLERKLTALISPQPIAIAYKKCYQMVGVDFAGWTYKQIDKQATGKAAIIEEIKSDPISFFSEKWRKLMSLFFETDGGTRITQVTDTTRETVMKALSDTQDLPTSQRATALVKTLNSPDFNRDRALRIARTESTTAANYGAILGAQESDYETGKVWLPIMDANTRPDHADMDGTSAIGMDEVFEVGSSLMQYPGDISAPANEVVNCRCALGVVPMVDSTGLPILKVG